MPAIVLRLGILVLLGLATSLIVVYGRRFVEIRRRQALSAPLSDSLPLALSAIDSPSRDTQVRILAFSTAECKQCHLLQTPALRRVLEARGSEVTVIHVDAATDIDFTQRYRVLTVPSTVILDTSGRAHAVNYGFANTQRLLDQVDAVLAQAVL